MRTQFVDLRTGKAPADAHHGRAGTVTWLCSVFQKHILEFKVDKPVEDALWQLEEKDYASVYSDRGKIIVQAGIVFSREKRNIVAWQQGGKFND